MLFHFDHVDFYGKCANWSGDGGEKRRESVISNKLEWRNFVIRVATLISGNWLWRGWNSRNYFVEEWCDPHPCSRHRNKSHHTRCLRASNKSIDMTTPYSAPTRKMNRASSCSVANGRKEKLEYQWRSQTSISASPCSSSTPLSEWTRLLISVGSSWLSFDIPTNQQANT